MCVAGSVNRASVLVLSAAQSTQTLLATAQEMQLIMSWYRYSWSDRVSGDVSTDVCIHYYSSRNTLSRHTATLFVKRSCCMLGSRYMLLEASTSYKAITTYTSAY